MAKAIRVGDLVTLPSGRKVRMMCAAVPEPRRSSLELGDAIPARREVDPGATSRPVVQTVVLTEGAPMSASVSAFDVLMSEYIDARTDEAPLWQAVEAARQHADAAFDPSLLSAWFARHQASERLFRKIEALQLEGKGWHA